jgi:hypothetical protein
VHLRRALLLFAIVLGLAAIAASVSREDEDSSSPPPTVAEQPEPTVEPGSATESEQAAIVELEAGPRERVRIEAGRAVTVEVDVPEPGLVEIPMLGLTATGEPLTPARFDILASEPARIEVQFTPAETDEPEPAGTLVVTDPER